MDLNLLRAGFTGRGPGSLREPASTCSICRQGQVALCSVTAAEGAADEDILSAV
jgi:hypothetical protein